MLDVNKKQIIGMETTEMRFPRLKAGFGMKSHNTTAYVGK
jgi:hypothetical protein